MWKQFVIGIVTTCAVTAIACGSSDEDTGCPDGGKDCREIATVEDGKAAVVVGKRDCENCHEKNLAGRTQPMADTSNPPDPKVKLYPPNLTNNKETGLGTWTDDQIAEAIRHGVDNKEVSLCPQMNHNEKMTDFETYSIVKYLRTLDVKQDIQRSVCPPFKE